MSFWNPDSIRAACAGTWLVRPPQISLPPDRPADLPLPPLHAPILGISTDTRSIKQGQAFIALRGETHDAHAHLSDAVRAGAPILIIDDEASIPSSGFTPTVGVLKVADTTKALLKLAAAYRQSLTRTKVIGVCGSNGKTTTTRLIHQTLSQSMRGSASVKSFNNSIGVPLTILAAKENDQYLVCEIGTNAPGEIALLAEVVRPDIAVITSIGREHLEKLHDLAGVAKEEAAVLKSMKPDGWAIVTADAPDLVEHLKRTKNIIRFGIGPAADLRATRIAHEVRTTDGAIGLVIGINSRLTLRMNMIGEHNALNALAALAVARRMGIDEGKSLAALAKATGPEMRLECTRVKLAERVGGGTALLVNDAYNANPDSMLAAIATIGALRREFRAQTSPSSSPSPSPSTSTPFSPSSAPGDAAVPRAVLVLGEMLELGAASFEAHRDLGKSLAEMCAHGLIDQVVLVGEGMKPAWETLSQSAWALAALSTSSQLPAAQWLPSAEEPHASAIAELIRQNDLLLLKGSRRVKLERVIAAISALGSVGAAPGPASLPSLAAGSAQSPTHHSGAHAQPTTKPNADPIGRMGTVQITA